MPATLITSAAGYGKTNAAIQHIVQAKRQAPFDQTWVLLPNELQISVFRQRILDAFSKDERVVFGVSFFNFYSMNAHLLDVVGNPQQQLSEAALFRVLRQIVVIERTRLTHFQTIAETTGFIRLVSQFILELKQAMILPETFSAWASTPKDRDLALIYEAYQNFLIEKNLVDREGVAWLTLRWLEQHPNYELPVKMLVVDGFDQFSVVQTRILNHLADRLPQTVLTLTYEPNRAETAHRRFAQTRQRLLTEADSQTPNLWRELRIDPLLDNQRHPLLYTLSDRLFEPLTEVSFVASGSLDDTAVQEAIQLIEAPDRRREVLYVLRAVKGLLLNDVSPEQISIVARDLEAYRPYFIEFAPLFKVPLQTGRGLALSDNPAVHTLLSLLTLAKSLFRRREVIDVLRSPYLDIPMLKASHVDQLDRVSREQVVVRHRHVWQQALHLAAREQWNAEEEMPLTEEQIAAQQTTYTELEERLMSFFDRVTPPEGATARGFMVWIEGLIGPDPLQVWLPLGDEQIASTAPDFGMIKRIRAHSDAALVSRDIAALHCLKNTLAGLLSAYELVDAERVYTWDEFWRDLQIAINHSTIDPMRRISRHGRVLLASVFEVRGIAHDHLFLMGMSEGEFPQLTAMDSFYLDSERLVMQQDGLPLLTQAEAADESGLFYEVVALARQRLTLTRPYVDDRDSSWPSSPYWRAVLDITGTLPQIISLTAAASLETAAYPAEMMLALAQRLQAGPDELAADAHRWLLSQPHIAEVWQQAQRGHAIEQERGLVNVPYNAYSGVIDESDLLAHIAEQFGPDHRWSASQLNEFGTCPYQFFAKRLLKLAAIGEPVEGMDQLQHGQLYHEILELTYREIAARQLPISADQQAQALDILDNVMDHVFQTAPARYGFRATALWREEQAEHRRKLRTLVQKDFSDASPLNKLLEKLPDHHLPRYTLAQEIRFGADPHNEVILQGEAGEVHVYGVIDRIDVVNGELAIIDYKTGSQSITELDIRAARQVQLVLYAHAAHQLFPDNTVYGGAYWLVGKQGLGGKLIPEDQQDLLAETEGRIHANIMQARRGNFASHPSKPDGDKCTQYCEYSQLCRLAVVNRDKLDAAATPPQQPE